MRKESFPLILFLFLLLFLFPSVSFAVVPSEINFQGVLKDKDGNLLSDKYKMTFRIHSTAEAEDPRWTEVHPQVEVDKGLYSVRLGSISPIDSENFGGAVKYLEIEVNDEKMSPRIPLISVPYAIQAEQLTPKIIEVSGYTELSHDETVVFVDANYWGVTIRLPITDETTNGKIYYIYKIDPTSNYVLVTAQLGGDKINGSLAPISTKQQWSCIRVVGHKKNEWIATIEDAVFLGRTQITGSTPSVSNGNYFEVVNGPFANLTNFTGGVPGQIITLNFLDINTTVRDVSWGGGTSNIKLSGSTDKTFGPDDILQLVYNGQYWYEISRSDN